MILKAIPDTNDINVNKDWLDAIFAETNYFKLNRHNLLLLVKGLHEISHLLTRAFIQRMDPDVTDLNTPVKFGQWCGTSLGN